MMLFLCIMLGTFVDLMIWFYAALAAVSLVAMEPIDDRRRPY